MSCTVRDRIHVHNVANALAQCECVLGVDVCAPNVGPHTNWTVEATLSRGVVPTDVLQTLAGWGVTLVDASLQGSNMIVTATV